MPKQKRKPYSYFYARRMDEKIKKFEIGTDLNQEKSCIMRLDGVGMTKQFKTKELINEEFEKLMEHTMSELISYFPSAIFAYQFSDEISVLMDLKIDDIYEKRVEKLITIASSKAGATFTRLKSDNKDYCFDCRLIQPDSEKMNKYFESRQAYAIYRFLEKLRNTYLPGSGLENYDAIVQALKILNPQVIYKDFPLKSRNGLLAFRNNETKEWIIEEAKYFLNNEGYLKTLINGGIVNGF